MNTLFVLNYGSYKLLNIFSLIKYLISEVRIFSKEAYNIFNA